MSDTPPQRPVLPDADAIGDLNLLQYVYVSALRQPDDSIRQLMDMRALYALGIGAWVGAEVQARLTVQGDPAVVLVSCATRLTFIDTNDRCRPTLGPRSISFGSRVSRACTTFHRL